MKKYEALKKLYINKQYRQLLEQAGNLSEQEINSWVLVGLSYSNIADYSSALKVWQKLEIAHGASVKIHYQKASAYRGLSNYEYAINEYKMALQVDKIDPAVLNDLLTCYIEIGRIDDAINHSNLFREFVADNFLFTINYTKLFVQLPAYFRPFKNRVPENTKLSIEFGVYRCLYRLNQLEIGKFKSEYNNLANCKTSLYPVSTDVNKKNALAYFIFMGTLKQQLSEREFSNSSLVYHFGDSHSITFASQKIDIGGVPYFVKPETVIGIKAWHLVTEKDNQWKSILEKKIKAIPAGSIAFISIGEIDFRHDQGVILQPGDQIFRSQNLARGYIEWLFDSCKNQDIKFYVFNIPAPVRLKSETAETIQSRIANIRAYNKELIVAAKIRGIPVVDQYDLTADNNGLSNGKFHIDGFHLKPETLKHYKF